MTGRGVCLSHRVLPELLIITQSYYDEWINLELFFCSYISCICLILIWSTTYQTMSGCKLRILTTCSTVCNGLVQDRGALNWAKFYLKPLGTGSSMADLKPLGQVRVSYPLQLVAHVFVKLMHWQDEAWCKLVLVLLVYTHFISFLKQNRWYMVKISFQHQYTGCWEVSEMSGYHVLIADRTVLWRNGTEFTCIFQSQEIKKKLI